ncbi:DUF5719 family protein [Microbacterium sp.]|uniref:DUF5719 family protein n=1 Tax=Microbacterium sp. TaxID=51671 RepID=UPI0039E3C184
MTPTGSRGFGARAGIGAAVSVALVIGVGAAVALPWPNAEREPVSVTAQPQPTASTLSCVGPVLAAGRNAADAGQLTDAADSEISAATGVDALEATTARLAAPDVARGVGPEALEALPVEGKRTDLAAAGSTSVSDEDLRGFAASSCAPARLESWIAGGSGTTGAADLLLIANPSAVAAEVSLTVYGAQGATEPAAATGIVVAPRTQRVVPLATIALGEESPVVRVTSSGAPVQVSLQASITRTLVPGGVDQVGVTAAPATRQVIPALSVVATPGQAGASESATVLRVLSPSADTEARVVLTPLGGGATVTDTLPLLAGVPAELELGSLPRNAYRVEVVADEPIVTAAWTTTGFGAGSDFAWHTAPAPLNVPSLVAVAAGPSPKLTVSNDSDAAARMRLTGPDGEQEIAIEAGSSARVAVQPGAVYRLDGGGARLRANVTYYGPGSLAGYDVVPADAASEPVVVFTQ